MEISLKQFKELRETMTNRELAKFFGVSVPTVDNIVKRNGLAKKRSGRRSIKYVD
jgi:transposase